MALFFIYYPGYYEQKLQNDIVAKKEVEMLEWSKEFCLKLEEQNIIAGIREKTDREIKKEKEILKASAIKARAENIKRMEKIIKAEKGASKWLGEERNEKIKKLIKEQEKILKELKIPKPDVYKYSNVEQLLPYFKQCPYDVSFWEIKNIDISNFSKMPVEDAEAYIVKNAVFKKIISSNNIRDKKSFSIKPGDEYHTQLTDTFLTNGLSVLTSQDWNYGSFRLMKLLNPTESQICVLIDDIYLGNYRFEISHFYQYMRLFLAFLIITIPIFYIIFEHKAKAKPLNRFDSNPLNKKWTPSIWQVMRGSQVGLAIGLYILPIIPGIILLAIFIEEIMGFSYSKIYSFLALTFFSLSAIALVALPVLLKTLKVRRLFRMGKVVECVFTEELYSGSSRPTKDADYNVYSYKFNGKTYAVKEIQLDNQKGFIEGKTKLTALVDPAEPNRAIIKENFLPNAESIKYEIPEMESSFKDFCVICGLEGYEAICPNCEQICNALEKDPKILDSYNKGIWKSINFNCSECSTKLEIENSESDSNRIFCPKCKWSTHLNKNIDLSDFTKKGENKSNY